MIHAKYYTIVKVDHFNGQMKEMESHITLLYKTSKHKLKNLKTTKNNYGNWCSHSKNEFFLRTNFISKYWQKEDSVYVYTKVHSYVYV